MAKWEYLVRAIALDKESEVVIQYMQRHYPGEDWKALPKYDPMILEAWLNQYAAEGWELMSIEQAQSQGKQGDIGRTFNEITNWARIYLCVFKRPAG